ncbi:MAG TPA: VWA domain-containing protein [Thermoanaerobaculia bacterium]|nr:VWA domain-containing protein [Thermoanaerobaculia bacterium]
MWRSIPLLASGLALATATLAAQPVVVPQLTETYSVGYVMVPFSVIDTKGRPIPDLKSNEITLLVDGRPVETDMFEKSTNAPVSFTILVDASGSMGLAGKMESARTAVAALTARRVKGDDFALYVFAESEAREVVPFTENPYAILRALAGVHPYGKTAFFDALAAMPERSRLGKNPSRAVILLSDGIDNASSLTRRDLERLLEGIAVPIYPLGLRDFAAQPQTSGGRPREDSSDLVLLEEVANLTGGRMYVGDRPEQIADAVESLEKILRAQYLVGFSPTGKGGIEYRRISLRLAGRIQSVRVRAGYRGTEPPTMTASREKNRRNEKKGSR